MVHIGKKPKDRCAYLHFESNADAGKFLNAYQGKEVDDGFNGGGISFDEEEVDDGSTDNDSPNDCSPTPEIPPTHPSSTSSMTSDMPSAHPLSTTPYEDQNIDDDSLLKRLHNNAARSLKRLANDFANLEKFYAEK
ncbi:hypothetical protein INT45_010316 [Circinella minor]|uniref:Uncharacterized protein n=1 Tax=Circinella minor TaxID=1195481 RepID=A0A8H7VSJ5_9FUNG|nr:hypothetical protein INT45_010316 [Circinella minor]